MVLAACRDDGDGGGTQCAGGARECTISGKEGTACCDPDDCGSDSNNCEAVCQVCS